MGHGSRGPAPPLPEKPPSVAERTRLLKSSFRKEESERPKIDTNRSSPLAETPKSVGSSVSSLSTNGDREESPTPIINNVSSNTVIKPAPLLNSPVQDNRDVEKMMVRMNISMTNIIIMLLLKAVTWNLNCLFSSPARSA